MTTPSTRDTVIAVARELFARRGYTATTIKDIAAAAGCSPALVIKLTGSKADLFAAADPSAPALEEPADEVEAPGYALVRRILDRRDHDEPEPWAMVPILITEAADPAVTRAETRTRYLDGIARKIGDTSPDRLRTQLVTAQLLGLGAAVRHLELLDTTVIDRDVLLRHYGDLVQSIIDSDAGALRPR